MYPFFVAKFLQGFRFVFGVGKRISRFFCVRGGRLVTGETVFTVDHIPHMRPIVSCPALLVEHEVDISASIGCRLQIITPAF